MYLRRPSMILLVCFVLMSYGCSDDSSGSENGDLSGQDAADDAPNVDASGDDVVPDAESDTETAELEYVDRSEVFADLLKSTIDVELVDLDGDARLDIVFANQAGEDEAEPNDELDVLLNQGDGQFERVEQPALAEHGGWQRVLAVDVDADQDMDLVVTRATRSGDQLEILLNDGTGQLSIDEDASPALSGDEYGIVFGRPASGDVDGDGDEDIFVPVAFNAELDNDRPNVLLLNDGTGVFSIDEEGRLPILMAATDFTYCAVIGDVTGEGALDIFLGESENPKRLLVNDGDGFFSDSREATANLHGDTRVEAARAYDCEIADTDGDGDLDIVMVDDASSDSGGTEGGQQPPMLLVNDGSGVLEAQTFPGTEGSYRGVGVGDVGGDGSLDLVIGNDRNTADHGGRAIEVFVQGADSIEAAADMPPLEAAIYSLAVGDLNGDGAADIVGAVGAQRQGGSLRNVLLMSH